MPMYQSLENVTLIYSKCVIYQILMVVVEFEWEKGSWNLEYMVTEKWKVGKKPCWLFVWQVLSVTNDFKKPRLFSYKRS